MPEEVGLFHRNVLQRARLSALRKICVFRFNLKGNFHPAGEEAAGPVVDSKPSNLGGEHSENGGRLLQDQGRRHVLEKATGQHLRPRQLRCSWPGTDQKSLPEIELFGGRDHTTVLHGAKWQRAATDDRLNQQLHVLEQTLKTRTILVSTPERFA
jgi:hypothetical protein